MFQVYFEGNIKFFSRKTFLQCTVLISQRLSEVALSKFKKHQNRDDYLTFILPGPRPDTWAWQYYWMNGGNLIMGYWWLLLPIADVTLLLCDWDGADLTSDQGSLLSPGHYTLSDAVTGVTQAGARLIEQQPQEAADRIATQTVLRVSAIFTAEKQTEQSSRSSIIINN